MFLAPISVYPDIVCNIGYISEPISAKNPISEWQLTGKMEYRARYRRKNADIGSNFHDIGGGNLRVCSDMYPISDTILTISGTISASKTRYRYLGRRYRIMSNIEFDIPISGQPVSDPISGPISDPISDIG